MANITSTIEVITPEKAAEYLNHNVHNRKLNKGQVAYYARMMSEGKWALNGQAIVFDTEGNLLDGQHRLQAVIMAQVPIQSFVVRNIVGGAFTTIDQGKARTASDVFSIEGIPNFTLVPAAIRRLIRFIRGAKVTSLSTFTHGTSISDRYNGDHKVSTSEILEEYNSRSDFWQEECRFARLCAKQESSIMHGADIMAVSAYLQLFKGHDAELVHDFFTQLFFEGRTKNSTLVIYRRMCRKDKMSPSMTKKCKFQLFIKCWEAFKKNKEYKILRWVEETEGEYSLQ